MFRRDKKCTKSSLGVGSKFPKGGWYLGISDCEWSGPDALDFLPEMNIEKYRLQRRVTGPAYAADFMKELEGNLNLILEKNIKIMHDRAGQSVNIDIFFNFFTSGQSLYYRFSLSLLISFI
jgi:hypothetical protein